jgi:hypothetical protein
MGCGLMFWNSPVGVNLRRTDRSPMSPAQPSGSDGIAERPVRPSCANMRPSSLFGSHSGKPALRAAGSYVSSKLALHTQGCVDVGIGSPLKSEVRADDMETGPIVSAAPDVI